MAQRSDEQRVRTTALVRGRVQGVGFRWWVREQALELGVSGHARNLEDGSVEVVAEGLAADVDALLERLQGDFPGRPGRVSGVSARRTGTAGSATGFEAR